MMEDSLAEDRHSPVPGLVHRYPDRVLMLVTTQCASYCRYCTRSRIVGDASQNFNRAEHEAQLDYMRRTPQIRDVLISGGDALTLDPKLLESIIRGIREIPHVEIIRIGSRVPVFLPQRVDDELCEMLAKYHPLWMNLHFNHPNEITPEVARACDKLTRAGIPLGNQSVLLAGVNDCVHVMRALVQRLVENRIRPYYIYQCDLVEGSGHFRTPVGKGIEIMEGLRGHTSRLRGPDLRRGRSGRRRQDPGHAQLPDQLLGPQGDPAQLRGLHHHLRGAGRVRASRQVEVLVLPASAPAAGPGRRRGTARRQPDVDRAGRFRAGPPARPHGAAPAGRSGQVGALRRRPDRRHGARPPLPALEPGSSAAPGADAVAGGQPPRAASRRSGGAVPKTGKAARRAAGAPPASPSSTTPPARSPVPARANRPAGTTGIFSSPTP